MSLTPDERQTTLALCGLPSCPKCGDELTAYDDGVTPPRGALPAGAYVLCDTCGWCWPSEDDELELLLQQTIEQLQGGTIQ